MDGLLIFLASSTGQLVCKVLIGAGIMDLLMAQVVFGRNITKFEQSISPGMAPQEKQDTMNKIKAMQNARAYMIIFACVILVFGVFGLTR